jgi:hypothetical protein
VWYCAGLTQHQRAAVRRIDTISVPSMTFEEAAEEENKDTGLINDDDEPLTTPAVASATFEGYAVAADVQRDDYSCPIFPELRPHDSESMWIVVACERLRAFPLSLRSHFEFLDRLSGGGEEDRAWASGAFIPLFGVHEMKFDQPVNDRHFAEWHSGTAPVSVSCRPVVPSTPVSLPNIDTSFHSPPFNQSTAAFAGDVLTQGGVPVLARWQAGSEQADLFKQECKARKLQVQEDGTALSDLCCYWVSVLRPAWR